MEWLLMAFITLALFTSLGKLSGSGAAGCLWTFFAIGAIILFFGGIISALISIVL
jgi:hypothetical protein